jgi:hypothetical protein
VLGVALLEVVAAYVKKIRHLTVKSLTGEELASGRNRRQFSPRQHGAAE